MITLEILGAAIVGGLAMVVCYFLAGWMLDKMGRGPNKEGEK